MAYTPLPGSYEPEHRYQFSAKNPAGVHVVVSGNVLTSDDLRGNEDETVDNVHEVHFIVGPWWRDVNSVVPSVRITGFINSDADIDDEQGWNIRELTWDTVGGTGPNISEERIRLKFKVRVRGEKSIVRNIGYYLIASGRRLGEVGLKSPGPVH
ncbi:MAG: hypothetical protein ACR2MT_11730 [Aurantibacter sp.]